MRLLLMSGLIVTLAACDDGAQDTVESDIIDVDEDGFSASVDCNDEDADINPAATEICDEVDNNCDGDIDGGTGLTVYVDNDEDGFGDRPSPATNCDVPFGFAPEGGDCDDDAEFIFPGADELCNNFDDDCDGATDEDAVDARSWYVDEDGDGFGDDATEEKGCDVPAGFAYEGGDCNERDPAINPGTPERCNGGLDDDCNPDTRENGVVSFYSYTEDVTYDLTPIFQSGTALFPAHFVNELPGEMTFCGGKWFGAITTYADLDIRTVGGSLVNELDAAGRYPTLAIVGDEERPLFVTVDGLTMRRGDARREGMRLWSNNIFRASGGGIYCRDVASLAVTDAVISETNAEAGGAVYMNNCDASFIDTEIIGNQGVYAAGINMEGGDLYMENSLIAENEARYGAAIYTTGAGSKSNIEIVDTMIRNNVGYYGPAAYLDRSWNSSFDTDMKCVDTEPADTDGIRGGVLANESTYPWSSTFGVIYIYTFYGDNTFTSEGCDFGEPETDEDNTPLDIYYYKSWNARASLNYGNDAYFSCDDGCN